MNKQTIEEFVRENYHTCHEIRKHEREKVVAEIEHYIMGLFIVSPNDWTNDMELGFRQTQKTILENLHKAISEENVKTKLSRLSPETIRELQDILSEL